MSFAKKYLLFLLSIVKSFNVNVKLCVFQSMGRLTVAVVLTLYVLVAVPLFEEPDLLEMFGDKYRHYMKTTPMIFPLRLWTSHSNTEKDK